MSILRDMPKDVIIIKMNGFRDADKACDWCRKQFGMRSVPEGIWDYSGREFLFKREEDAALFVLRWS